MKKKGRPSKLDKIDLKEVERLAAGGLIDTQIAALMNINERSLARYKQNPDFCHAIKKGKEEADSKVISKLWEKACNGDTVAMIFWLKNRQKDNWRDKVEHEHSGNEDKPIKFIIEYDRNK